MRGVGLILPFQRDGRGDFANGLDEATTNSEIEMVLTTVADAPKAVGELPWRTAFGSGLHRLRFMPNDIGTVEIARSMIRDAFQAWLPELLFRDVSTQRDNNRLELFIFWGYRTDSKVRGPAQIRL